MRKIFGGASAFLLVLLVVAPALTFGAESDIVRLRGVVMSVDLKKNTVVVNERRFFMNQSTVIRDQKGMAIPPDKLKKKDWVYLEGVHDKASQKLVARKIHFLSEAKEEKGGTLIGK